MATYSSTSSQLNPSTELTLTFGAEIEFCFMINKSKLPKSRYEYLQVKHNDKRHRDDDPNGLDGSRLMYHTHVVQVSRLLRTAGLRVRTRAYPGSVTDYQVFSITTDATADLFKQDIIQRVPRITNENVSEWSTAGLELVTRVLPAPSSPSDRNHPSLLEIGRYVSALESNIQDPYIALAPADKMGLHVHIGQPSGLAPPLPVLQHLAYITVQYEGIISALHHPSRLGYQSTTSAMAAESNLMGLRGSGHICDEYPLSELTEIQNRIFAPSQSVWSLAKLMSDTGNGNAFGRQVTRNKFVNWTRLRTAQMPIGTLFANLATSEAATLEFRQHHATLSASQISHWVCFIVALIRAAERQAHLATPPPSPTKREILKNGGEITYPMRQGSKYQFICTAQRDRVAELFDLLQLGRQAQKYWMDKFQEYNPNEFTDRPWSEKCLRCAQEAFSQRFQDMFNGFSLNN